MRIEVNLLRGREQRSASVVLLPSITLPEVRLSARGARDLAFTVVGAALAMLAMRLL